MELWLWKHGNEHLFSRRDEFIPVLARQPTFQHALVAIAAKPNPSAAQRAIERGEVLWRRYYEAPWRKVQKASEPLLQGWPIELRWTVPFSRGYAELMWPAAVASIVPGMRQGRRFWSTLMPGGPGGSWLPYWLDKLEQTWGLIGEPIG